MEKTNGNPQFRRVTDTIGGGQIYTFVDADIVNNSITRNDNYFTIDRGKRHGVFPKMGVIAPNGIAGIVVNTTNNYALVQSVLSVNKIRINAALKNTGFSELLLGKETILEQCTLQTSQICSSKSGRYCFTDGKSSIFPQGIMIGKVAGYEVDSKTGYWDISVELNQKMGNLQKVLW
jgi:rod shape-determining protein MreC